MKTVFATAAFLFLIASAYGQRMTQNQASAIFNETTRQLKSNDTAAFVNMWFYDNTPRPSQETPFTKGLGKAYFEHIQEWMDTALNQNLPIDHIDIDKQSANDPISAAYLIKAWYRYDPTYAKAYGFYVDYVDGAWRFRFNPETSAAWRK